MEHFNISKNSSQLSILISDNHLSTNNVNNERSLISCFVKYSIGNKCKKLKYFIILLILVKEKQVTGFIVSILSLKQDITFFKIFGLSDC